MGAGTYIESEVISNWDQFSEERGASYKTKEARRIRLFGKEMDLGGENSCLNMTKSRVWNPQDVNRALQEEFAIQEDV